MKYRFLIAFVLFALCVCALASCGNGADTDINSSGTTTGDAENASTPSIPGLVLDAEAIAKYKIVSSSLDEEKKMFLGIKKSIGVDLGVLGAESEPTEYEILIGETGREESSEAYAKIRPKDYIVELNGSKIVIAGGTEESLSAAVDYFLALAKDKKIVIAADFSYYCEGEYSAGHLKINGVSISEYTIVYNKPMEATLTTANYLQAKIKELTGHTLKVSRNSSLSAEEKADPHKIFVGNPDSDLPFYSYNIAEDGGEIKLSGYDTYAVDAAAIKLCEIFSPGGELSSENIEYEYELPDREEYMSDIDKLYMRWAIEWEPDTEMLDYEAKLDAFVNVSDRLLTCAHRADADYYPENSIESIISFYRMGGDVVELDIQATKDGVLILMHDDTLSRTTNWADLKGKTVNGVTLSTSNNVCDWTYKQIQQLSLKEGSGFTTPFKVPTLVEALEICKDRLLIIPDKTDKWTYIPDSSGKPSLFDCMKEADNYESILISYGFTNNPSGAVDVQKYIYDKSGVRPFLMVRSNNDPVRYVYNHLAENAPAGSFGIQVGGSFDQSSFPTTFKNAYDTLKGKVLMWGWTIDDVDDTDIWQEMYDLGYRMIMTNDYLGLVKYAASIGGFN